MKYLSLILIAATILYSSCRKKTADSPQTVTTGETVCPGNAQAHYSVRLNSEPEVNSEGLSNNEVFGGGVLKNINPSDADTLVINFGFIKNDLSYSFTAAIPSPTGAGTYTFDQFSTITSIYENTAGVCNDFTLTIDEISDAVQCPGVMGDCHKLIRGSFTGNFNWHDPATVTMTGQFCADLP